ncbi:MAG: epoxyqueuosine reductase [Clostridia bacterium]|nr:epoxyqueuosine reductase [Clostridia bacterium]
MSLNEIMNGISPLWGICPFDEIKNNLIPCRAKSRLPENSKTVIVACFPYLLDEAAYKNRNISKYAVVTDYHEVALARLGKAADSLRTLYPKNKFEVFADNSPIPEVRAACAAGLGIRGINSLLITEKYGSYVFIGEIVTDLEADFDSVEYKACIGCGKCIDACPAKAVGKSDFSVEKCLSAVTQRKGELSVEEERLMKECGCVWGCDICQDVCPMNKNAAVTEIEEFLSSPVAHVSSGCELEGRAYEWRGRKVIERNIAIQTK